MEARVCDNWRHMHVTIFTALGIMEARVCEKLPNYPFVTQGSMSCSCGWRKARPTPERTTSIEQHCAWLRSEFKSITCMQHCSRMLQLRTLFQAAVMHATLFKNAATVTLLKSAITLGVVVLSQLALSSSLFLIWTSTFGFFVSLPACSLNQLVPYLDYSQARSREVCKLQYHKYWKWQTAAFKLWRGFWISSAAPEQRSEMS